MYGDDIQGGRERDIGRDREIHRSVCVCDRERECEDGQNKDNISHTKTVNHVMQNDWLYDNM